MSCEMLVEQSLNLLHPFCKIPSAIRLPLQDWKGDSFFWFLTAQAALKALYSGKSPLLIRMEHSDQKFAPWMLKYCFLLLSMFH